MRKMIAIALVAVAALALCACSKSQGASELGGAAEDGFSVSIEVECEENLLFGKYDLEIYVDDSSIGTLDHGVNNTFEANLAEGKHTLRAEKKGDASCDGSVDFEVSGDTDLRCKMRCTSSQVEVDILTSLIPPVASDAAIGKSQFDICQQFKDAGFKYVSVEEVKDLAVSERDKVNTVVSVSVGGNDQFSSDDGFFADDKVVVRHHQLKDINPPYSSDDAEGLDCQIVVSRFEELGFANVRTEQVSTSDPSEEGIVSGVSIGWRSFFSADDTFWPDEEVTVSYYRYDGSSVSPESTGSSSPEASGDFSSENSESYDEFDKIAAAKRVFEFWGDELYPYGFKCHWILGNIAQEVNEDGSVFLKVEVTIENAFGNKVKEVAEGTVRDYVVEGFCVY